MPQRAHSIRLNPTPEQHRGFLRAAGVARFTWNWALDEYKQLKSAGERVRWAALKRKFNAIKRDEFPFVCEVTKCAAEGGISDLRRAVNIYYKAKPQNPRLRFPSYRKRGRKIGSFGVANDKFAVVGHTAYLPKLGTVNMAEPLRFDGKILSGRITERAGRWYLVVVVEIESQPVAEVRDSVGIDFGLSRFATLSTGEVCETQAFYRRSECKLKKLQRALARKQRGSSNRARWKLRVARMHERVRNQRVDYIHKFTTMVAQTFAIVCVEDLNLKGLHRTRLAKSFSDAGIGEAIHQLSYKAMWLQKVGRFYPSSQLCSACGQQNTALTLSDRAWTCGCGGRHDRDLNASMNIELEGMHLLAGNGYLGVTPVERRALAHALA